MRSLLILFFVFFSVSVNCQNQGFYRGSNNNIPYQFGPNSNVRPRFYDDSDSAESEEYYVDFQVPRETEDTLLLVNVLFRHGNRTANGHEELYPNDPFANFEYFPYGLGQLTKAGKLREYSIGTSLRNKYNFFLGEHYYPDIVEARSTDYNRTKMSLQLVLAGLFPPRQDDIFVQNLQTWQPVPYNYLPKDRDFLLLGAICKRYLDLYEKYKNTPKNKKEFKYYSKLFKYIAKHTGRNVTSYADVYNLYFGISTEVEYGLTIPSWLKAVWPKQIVSMVIKEYYFAMGTKDMRKMLSGTLIQKIINDCKAKLTDTDPHGRKMYLYSAHESNVAHMLIALGVFDEQVPNYGAYVTIELHKINGVPKIRVLYENYKGNGPKALTIPKCEEYCPLSKFELLMSEILPKADDKLCR